MILSSGPFAQWARLVSAIVAIIGSAALLVAGFGALRIGDCGARLHKPELAWISSAAIVQVTLKRFMQDFRSNTPAALAVSLGCYGVVLIFGPRWTRQEHYATPSP